jgi:hypothetical protein
MSNSMGRAKKAAIGTGLVLGSLGVGGATAALLNGASASAATSPSSTATPGAQPTTGQKVHRFLRRHTVDATITVKTKNGYETFNLARGTVGAISTTSITVNSPDGTSLTATINAQTKFHNTSVGQLKTGDKVGVLASAGVAKVINAPKLPSSSSASSTPTS